MRRKSSPERTEFERFESLAKRLVQIPKKEIDEKAEEFKAESKKNGRRSRKPAK